MKLDIPVRTIMTGEVRSLRADATLTDALTDMVNGGFHHTPVVEGDEVVGMVAASDLMAELRRQPEDLEEMGVILDDRPVREVMIREVVTVQADAPLRAAVALFADKPFHALPVVSGRRLVGIVTTRDVCRHLLAD